MSEVITRRLCMNFSKVTYDNLMGFINKKQGYYKKGDITKWVEIAVRNLIATANMQQQNTRNLQTAQKQIMRLSIKWRDVTKYLQDKYGYEPAEGKTCPHKLLDDAVSNVCGLDIRTRKEWIKRFTTGGFIKQISHNAYQIIVSEFVIQPFNEEEMR